MTTTTVTVTVTRCGKCGLERFDFAAARGNCPRCSGHAHTTRRITSPHPDTVAQAIREGSSQRAVDARKEERAAEFERQAE